MGKYQDEVARATKRLQETQKNLKGAVVGYDAALAGTRFWTDLTDASVEPVWSYSDPRNIGIHIWMNAKKYGRYVTRRDFNEMVEIIDDYLTDRGYEVDYAYEDGYTVTVKLITSDFTIKVNSFAGGVCKRKVIATKTITVETYGNECE
jgi:hypothetical protein